MIKIVLTVILIFSFSQVTVSLAQADQDPTCAIPNCEECNNVGACTRCQQKYTYSAEKNTCVPGECPQKWCIQCGANGCDACGYGLAPRASDGECQAETRCDKSYFQCTRCSREKCLECSYEWQYPAEGKNCEPCPYRCANTCTSPTNCDSCKYGFEMEYDSNNKPTGFCKDKNCEVYDATGRECLACKWNMYWDGDICRKGNCPEKGCGQCGSKGCYKCLSRYVVSDGQCKDCSYGCENCDLTSCKKCMAGFEMVYDNLGNPDVCKVENCDVHDKTEEKCLACKNGFYFYSKYNTCKSGACDGNCEQCGYDGCYKCKEGFNKAIDSDGSKVCISPNCDIYSQKNDCVICKKGFGFKNNLCTTGDCLEENCEICGYRGCYQCKKGLFPLHGKCSVGACSMPRPGCDSCNANECTACADDYTFNKTDGICYQREAESTWHWSVIKVILGLGLAGLLYFGYMKYYAKGKTSSAKWQEQVASDTGVM